MKIDKELISHVADVARLKLTDEELKRFTPELKSTLEFFEAIAEVDTKGIDISIQPVELADAIRDDLPEECLTQEEALSNSNDNKDGYIKGPKAV